MNQYISGISHLISHTMYVIFTPFLGAVFCEQSRKAILEEHSIKLYYEVKGCPPLIDQGVEGNLVILVGTNFCCEKYSPTGELLWTSVQCQYVRSPHI